MLEPTGEMESAKNQEVKGDNPLKTDRRFMLWYMGWSPMDKRTTLPMLPWLLAEIRRRGERSSVGPAQPREVELTVAPPFIRCVPARSSNVSVFIFEHKAQFVSRFIHNSQDHTYFAYLIRSQPDDPESEMACHVFKACHPSQASTNSCLPGVFLNFIRHNVPNKYINRVLNVEIRYM